MLAVLAFPAVLFALASFESSVTPLSAPVRTELKADGFWHQGCPVALSDLRVLTVSHWGFDGRAHTGRLVVNENAARPLAGVFRQLYRLHFPIRQTGFAPATTVRR